MLAYNKQVYEHALAPMIQRKQQEEREAIQAQQKERLEAAKLANLEAQTSLQQQGAGLAQAKIIQTYGEMFADTIRSIGNGLNYIYKNKEKIVYRGSILTAGAYGMYVAAKAKLGFGQ
jgi:hypothetical protein